MVALKLMTLLSSSYNILSCFFQILGDQLAIGKETGRRLGMGVNMYPSASLLGNHKDESIAHLPVEELIEKADGFAGVFPGGFFSPIYIILYQSSLAFSIRDENSHSFLLPYRAQIRNREETAGEKAYCWNDRRWCKRCPCFEEGRYRNCCC